MDNKLFKFAPPRKKEKKHSREYQFHEVMEGKVLETATILLTPRFLQKKKKKKEKTYFPRLTDDATEMFQLHSSWRVWLFSHLSERTGLNLQSSWFMELGKWGHMETAK